MKLRLGLQVEKVIREHAELGYPLEVCGILLGKLGETLEANEARPCKNLNTERAHDRYLLDPLDQLRIEKDARARGLDIVGYYHSHPDHPALASVTDAQLAWEGVAYLILSVEKGRVVDQKAWQRKLSEISMVPLELITDPGH